MSQREVDSPKTVHSANEAPLLRVAGLRKEFELDRHRVLTAVDNVGFEIRSGETLALVGESGSGKTTVGRCLLRLLEPTAGVIEFDGRDISNLGARALRPIRGKIQVLFQDPSDSFNPRLTLGQTLGEAIGAFSTSTRSETKQRAGELLAMVGLDGAVAQQYPHHLTAGEQQRVAIARSLATDPKLIVLDEPTSSLDPISREEIVGLLGRVQEETGTALLFISHDLVTVQHICHRVAVMYLGEIVEEGPVATVFASPKHPYTMALLASVPRVGRGREESSGVVLSGEIPSPIALPKGCYLASRCPFVIDGCRSAHPELLPVGEGQLSRCARTTGVLPDLPAEYLKGDQLPE